MNPSGGRLREDADNPFDARHLRPGAIPFCWPPGRDVASLLTRLENSAWRGQIVGPHGSGKSALVAALVEGIERAGRPVVLVELHDAQRRLPVNLSRVPGLDAGAVVIVDGYEQLGRWSRFLLRRHCRRRRLGLVVTAHASMGFPDLVRSVTSLEQAVRIVRQLLGDRSAAVTRSEIRQLFDCHQGNLREVLFDLYDLYEERRRVGGASTGGTAS